MVNFLLEVLYSEWNIQVSEAAPKVQFMNYSFFRIQAPSLELGEF